MVQLGRAQSTSFWVFRVGAWGGALVVLTWALMDHRFRDSSGSLLGGVCLPLAFAAALGLIGWGWPQLQVALWLALALVGQAAALQFIDAGHGVRYPHYRPVEELAKSPIALGIVVVQSVVVLAGLRHVWPQLGRWLARNFRWWQLGGLGLGWMLTSATVSREVPRYVVELALAGFIQLVSLGNIVLFARAIPSAAVQRLATRYRRLVGEPTREQTGEGGPVDRLAWLVAGWVSLLAAVLCLIVYERHPHVSDEVIYLLHARYFAQGLLFLPPPPVPSAFNLDLMYYGANLTFSPFPPGWPAALAIGVRLGAAWLVNPVLAGVNVVLVYLLFRELYDRATARLAILLLAVSPWFIFMAMSFMAHTFTLTVALIAALAIIRARLTGRWVWGWVAGFALGIVSLARPLEALCLAAPLGLWAIGVGGKRLRTGAIAGLILGAGMIGALNLPYNQALTGNARTFPVMAYFDKYYGPHTNDMGFGPDRGVGWQIDPYPGHSPLEAMINADLNAFAMNVELLGWSVGSLLLAGLLVFSGRTRRSDHLMLAVIAVVFLLHGLYWFSGGPDFGARYWYLMLVPATALTVRGAQVLGEKLEEAQPPAEGRARVSAAILGLSFLAVVTFFPWRAIDKYHHYLGMRADIRRLAVQRNFGDAIVLVHGARHPDYMSAATYNPLDLESHQTVYAWDRDPGTRRALIQAFPDRRFWLVDGPTVTNEGFRVVSGPLNAGELESLTAEAPLGQGGILRQ